MFTSYLQCTRINFQLSSMCNRNNMYKTTMYNNHQGRGNSQQFTHNTYDKFLQVFYKLQYVTTKFNTMHFIWTIVAYRAARACLPLAKAAQLCSSHAHITRVTMTQCSFSPHPPHLCNNDPMLIQPAPTSLMQKWPNARSTLAHFYLGGNDIHVM